MFFHFKVNYMFYWRFSFWNEISIDCLFSKWKCTYVLDFGPWRVNCTQYGDLWTNNFQECKGNVFFEVGWARQQLSDGFKKISNLLWVVAQVPIHLPLKARRGVFNVPYDRYWLLNASTFWQLMRSPPKTSNANLIKNPTCLEHEVFICYFDSHGSGHHLTQVDTFHPHKLPPSGSQPHQNIRWRPVSGCMTA